MIRVLLAGYTQEQMDKLIDAIDAALDSLKCPSYMAFLDMDIEPPGYSLPCWHCPNKRACSDVSRLRDFLECEYCNRYHTLSPEVQKFKAKFESQ